MYRACLIAGAALLSPFVQSQTISELEISSGEMFVQDLNFRVHDPKLTFPKHIHKLFDKCMDASVDSMGSARKRLSSTKLTISCDGGREASFWARLEGSVDVHISSSRNRKGTPLDKAFFQVKRMSVQEPRDGFYVPSMLDGNFKLRRNVGIDDVLYFDDLEKVFDIEKGELVTAMVKVAGVAVSTKVVALDSGSAGESIEVVNKTSDKKFMATVVAKGVVEVQ